ALSRSSVARATVSLYLVPVVAMALAWPWLGERPSGAALLGGCLAVAGVVLVRRVRPPALPSSGRGTGSSPWPRRPAGRRPARPGGASRAPTSPSAPTRTRCSAPAVGTTRGR